MAGVGWRELDGGSWMAGGGSWWTMPSFIILVFFIVCFSLYRITTGIFFNCGQVCSATSRLLVHSSIKDKLLAAVVEIANGIKIGDGASGAKIGPVVNKIQYDKVCGYIQKSIDEGIMENEFVFCLFLLLFFFPSSLC
jgi:hypothetical protein